MTTNADRNTYIQRKQIGKGNRERNKGLGLKEAHKPMQILLTK